MLRTLITSIEFRWHAPWVLFTVALGVIYHLNGASPVNVVTVSVAVATAVSLVLMRVARNASNADDAFIAAQFPAGVRLRAHVLVSGAHQEALAMVPTPGDAFLLLGDGAGLHFVTPGKEKKVVRVLRWAEIDGVSGERVWSGSTAMEAAELTLAAGPVVRLATYATRSILGNDIILARPAANPWPGPGIARA